MSAILEFFFGRARSARALRPMQAANVCANFNGARGDRTQRTPQHARTAAVWTLLSFGLLAGGAVLGGGGLLGGGALHAQTSPLDSLLTSAQWDALFPRRAGTYGAHPQGYTSDFYSYANLKLAVEQMEDYRVRIRRKAGVWGNLITVERKASGLVYNYEKVDTSWHANPTPESVVVVDFADFAARSNDTNNRRELAAFLANSSKETTGGWQLPVGGGSFGDYALWGLYFVHEVGYTAANSAGAYSQAHAEYPPNPAKGYYGRGPIQLSWNYNYGQLSKFLFNDKNVLLNNPDSVQRNGVLAFQSALWFWMMPQCPKPSCHQVMHNLWTPDSTEYSAPKMYQKGFAHTNNIINGGLECRSTSSQAFTDKVFLRSELYLHNLNGLGFSAADRALENANGFTTLCFDAGNAMENYLNCSVVQPAPIGLSEPSRQSPRVLPNPARGTLLVGHPSGIRSINWHRPDGSLVRVDAGFDGGIDAAAGSPMGGTGTPGSPGGSAAGEEAAGTAASGASSGGTAASQRTPQTVLLDLTSLPPGLYLLQIQTPDGSFAERVVVE